MVNILQDLRKKELCLFIYIFIFILGVYIGVVPSVYNEYRLLELFLLLGIVLYSLFNEQYFFSRIEILFLIFVFSGYFFWDNYQFIIVDVLLAYLLYKSFHFLNYNDLVTKAIVFASLLIFILFPVSLFEYMLTGIYKDWHPLPWNIRVYNSYLLIVSIFAVWYYITDNKYINIYLAFIFLAFLSILLEGGRSATLAFSIFIMLVCGFNRLVRWRLAVTYTASWLSYICITYFANFNLSRLTAITSSTLDLHVVRATSSLRYDLWMNAYQCWLTSPLVGCGFYQLDGYTHLAAHPHNVFIQFVSETGLIGFSFLAFIMITIIRNIAWQSKNSYFVIAAFLALGVDLSLSGVHIYPVTQILLLWLFVFLLKNPAFLHPQYFNKNTSNNSSIEFYLSAITYFILTIIFIFLVIDAAILTEVVRFGGPRFWEHGYQL